MHSIVEKRALNPEVTLMRLEAPLIAKKVQSGQFIILRAEEEGERIPLTVAGADAKDGTITIIYQKVGYTTQKLDTLEVGDSLPTLAGPLGKASELEGYKKAAVIGGGLGTAIAWPQAKRLHELGCEVHSICGFRNKDLVILEKEMGECSDKLIVTTDDGSNGTKGFVTDALKKLIEDGNEYDVVIAIGPLIMMKFICKLTKEYGIKTIVSMNPIMIDGTGMCGGCRVTVGGKTKFACVDGPDFDGHEVDFDEAMRRGSMYKAQEKEILEKKHVCRLTEEVRQNA